MREDILQEEVCNNLQQKINNIKYFFSSNKGMWQRENKKEYPPDKGFWDAGILFCFVGWGFWMVTELFLLFSEESYINLLFVRSCFYFAIFFFCGSIILNTLDIYIYNHYKTKLFKYVGTALCIVFFLPMAPFLIFLRLIAFFLNIMDITFDTLTSSICIMGLDALVIVVLTVIGLFFSDYTLPVLKFLVRLIIWPFTSNINYFAGELFFVFVICSLLITILSKLFDYLIKKNRSVTERKQALKLIYLYKLMLLSYVFFIATFTKSFGTLNQDIGNVVTVFTLFILLKDKLVALFIEKDKDKEFKVQIEWKNNIKDIQNLEEIIENTNLLEENDEEITDEEEPVEQEEIKETIVEPPQIFYDSSTIKQPSYRYIRTHKLPDNRKIYRLRKERIGKIFLPK